MSISAQVPEVRVELNVAVRRGGRLHIVFERDDVMPTDQVLDGSPEGQRQHEADRRKARKAYIDEATESIARMVAESAP